MATKGKKPRARWDSDTERKLIDVWADILGEFSGIMMTRKKKEAIATTRLNAYVSDELNRPEKYNEKEVCNKLDTIMKKGKSMYVNYQRKGETGKEYTQDDVDIDIEAAEKAWPNFKTFFHRFKDHPALGPGAVEESGVVPGPSGLAGTEQEDVATPESSRPPSRAAVESVGDSEEEEEEEEEEDVALPASKKSKKTETPLVARVGKKKGKGTGAAQFLLAYTDMQEQYQLRQIEHESKMQEQAMTFQAKLEQDRQKFEAEMSARLQQQSAQFQMTLMQQNQLFQAELFKKMFEKEDKGKEDK